MKRILWVLIAIGVVGVSLSVVYLYKLHALAVEGNAIYEKRCISVNPQLIGYKKIFLMYAEQVNNPDWASGEEMVALMHSYIEHVRQYICAEDKWLAENGRFINRLDFRLIEPEYLQKAGKLQQSMYEGYREDAQSMVDLWDHPENAEKITSVDYVSPQRQKRDNAIDAYFSYYDEVAAINDWRKWFGRVPVPKGCTKENTTFPQTEGSIKWFDDRSTGPSDVPIDPYSVS